MKSTLIIYLTAILILLNFNIIVVDAEELMSKEGWSKAYSRRNYQLGITLEQFRAETFPDKKLFPGAYPVCSNEAKAAEMKYAEVYVFRNLNVDGLIICHHYFMSPIFNRVESADLLIADWGGNTDFYFVNPEGTTDYILYEIITTSKQPIFDELLDAYKVAMGKNPLISTPLIQNRMGATFENIIAQWENEVSTLRLEKYYSDLRTLGITYTLKSLKESGEKRIRKISEERAKKL